MRKKYADRVQLGTIQLKIEQVVSQSLPLLYRIPGLHVSYVYICLHPITSQTLHTSSLSLIVPASLTQCL